MRQWEYATKIDTKIFVCNYLSFRSFLQGLTRPWLNKWGWIAKKKSSKKCSHDRIQRSSTSNGILFCTVQRTQCVSPTRQKSARPLVQAAPKKTMFFKPIKLGVYIIEFFRSNFFGNFSFFRLQSIKWCDKSYEISCKSVRRGRRRLNKCLKIWWLKRLISKRTITSSFTILQIR